MSHLYTGSLTEELMALVERNLPVLPEPKLEPWLILAHARIHLANRVMTVGDLDAWFELKFLQEALFWNKPIECDECDGTGYYYPDRPSGPCERCGGRGQL